MAVVVINPIVEPKVVTPLVKAVVKVSLPKEGPKNGYELFLDVLCEDSKAERGRVQKEWLQVLIRGFYLHSGAGLMYTFYCFCEQRRLDPTVVRMYVLFPTFVVPRQLSVVRFISGYVPRLAEKLYTLTSKDATSIFAWLEGKTFSVGASSTEIKKMREMKVPLTRNRLELKGIRLAVERQQKHLRSNWAACK